MANRTRPKTLVERDICLRSGRAILAEPRSPVLEGLEQHDYGPARDAYEQARTGLARAEVLLGVAREAAHAAAAAFQVALRQWMNTVTDEKGRRSSADVAALLGGVRPGSLHHKRDVEQVSLTSELEAQLAECPRLLGDDEARAAMLAARQGMADAVDARAEAKAVHARARKTYTAATRDFDFAWGDLVRRVTRREPERAHMIPQFGEDGPRADVAVSAAEEVGERRVRVDGEAFEWSVHHFHDADGACAERLVAWTAAGAQLELLFRSGRTERRGGVTADGRRYDLKRPGVAAALLRLARGRGWLDGRERRVVEDAEALLVEAGVPAGWGTAR